MAGVFVCLVLASSDPSSRPFPHTREQHKPQEANCCRNDLKDILEAGEDGGRRLLKTHSQAHMVPWKGAALALSRVSRRGHAPPPPLYFRTIHLPGGLTTAGVPPGARIIVVTRNPKDAAVSMFHHSRQKSPIPFFSLHTVPECLRSSPPHILPTPHSKIIRLPRDSTRASRRPRDPQGALRVYGRLAALSLDALFAG